MKNHIQSINAPNGTPIYDQQHPGRSEKIDWPSVNSGNFWEVADQLQNSTLLKADKLFSVVQHAKLPVLQAILLQYRFFTIYYISDLALLVAKLDDGGLRSFLAEILSDELGCGNPDKAHPNLYDDFLLSIGVKEGKLNKSALKENIKLLDDTRVLLANSCCAYGVGLRGMGGECVCQVYITLLYKYLISNPYIVKNKSRIDWVFWDLHVGEHDINHRMETRNLINSEIVVKNDHSLHQLGCAYEESMRSWESFWINIFNAAMYPTPNIEFVSVNPKPNLHISAG